MSEELKRLGEILENKRKEKNLSLREIENATSIRIPYLQAIEDGTLSEVISGVYVQGFLKQYASFLGMDVDQLIKEHPEAFNIAGEKQDFSYGIGTLEVRGAQGGSNRWIPNFLWIALSAGVLVGVWYLAKFLGVV
jgi:cytoskeletal protein RodZ